MPVFQTVPFSVSTEQVTVRASGQYEALCLGGVSESLFSDLAKFPRHFLLDIHSGLRAKTELDMQLPSLDSLPPISQRNLPASHPTLCFEQQSAEDHRAKVAAQGPTASNNAQSPSIGPTGEHLITSHGIYLPVPEQFHKPGHHELQGQGLYVTNLKGDPREAC